MLMIVGHKPDSESLLFQEPFAGRDGQVLRKLLDRAGIGPVHLTYLEKEMGEELSLFEEIAGLVPELVIALGAEPAKVLLGEGSKFRLAHHVGKFYGHMLYTGQTVKVGVWRSSTSLLNGGRKSDDETVAFFKECNRLAFSVE